MKLVAAMGAGACLWSLGIGAATAQAPPSERLAEVGGAVATRVESSEAGDGTALQRSQAWARLNAPVALGGGAALVLGLSYEAQLIRYSGFGARQVDSLTVTQRDLPTALHAIDARVGLLWRFAERWSAAAAFTPGLHSDLGDVRGRDVVWGGSLLLVRSVGDVRPGGDTNRIGLGAAITDRFGSPLLVPLLLLDWCPSGRWFVKGTLPLELEAGRRISTPLSVGLEALQKGFMYRLGAAPFDGQVIRYREVQIGLFLDLGISERAHVRVSGGFSTGHEFELRDEGNDRTLVSGDFGSSLFARGTLYYAR